MIIGLWAGGIAAGGPVAAQSLLVGGLAVGSIALLAEPDLKTAKALTSAALLAAGFSVAELAYHLGRPTSGTPPIERVIEHDSVRYYPAPEHRLAAVETNSSPAPPQAASPGLPAGVAPRTGTRRRTGTDSHPTKLRTDADPNPTSILDTPPTQRDTMKAKLEEMYLSASRLLDRTIALASDGDIPQAQKDFDSFDTLSRKWLASNAGAVMTEEFRTEHQFTFGTPWAGDHDIVVVNQRQRIIDGLKSRRMNLREIITGRIEQEQSSAAQPVQLLFQDER